ncbi:hypothetical protein Cpir12675_005193 [Ceratocystis pirilliformis]|uniref:Uncharacterized protein n=1 Tax=Ceratocystis pirilliformis TaxID=259994 RepID=A0ABR3YRC7_9PEZI
MFCLRSHNWFIPRPPVDDSGAGSCLYGCPEQLHRNYSNYTISGLNSSESVQETQDFNSTVFNIANSTAGALAKALMDEAAHRRAEWTGLGMEWLRSLLGEREWRVDFLDIYVRL